MHPSPSLFSTRAGLALARVRGAADGMGVPEPRHFVAARTRRDGSISVIDYDLNGLLVRAHVLSADRVLLTQSGSITPIVTSLRRALAARFGCAPHPHFASEMFAHIADLATPRRNVA